jgi:hypothetical protein
MAAAIAAVLTVGAGPAWAAQDVGTRLVLTPTSATVDGKPVAIHAELRDANGKAVGGALLRLMVPVDFMGSTKDEIAAEATTNAGGKAVLRFSPAAAGPVEATVTFWGSSGYAESEAPVSFDVQTPVVVYTPAPVGLQAWWARSQMILLPFAVVWSVYVLVLVLVVRIRRAGASEPEQAPTR